MYPIVRQVPLSPRGPLARRRPHPDLPEPGPQEALVYRVGGRLVTETGRAKGDDLRKARSVVVVDVRRDVAVTVRTVLPGARASEFAVLVTFACTVIDPVAVARTGHRDVEAQLLAYLDGHPRLYELALGHEPGAVEEVRRDVAAELAAVTTVRPPALPGLVVAFVRAEVPTPAELADFHRRRRAQADDHALAIEREAQRQRRV
ncbi:hypothetical protein, partial [Actinocorallia lasiicapitis]